MRDQLKIERSCRVLESEMSCDPAHGYTLNPRAQRTIKLNVACDHFTGAKALCVFQTFFAPAPAFCSIGQSQERASYRWFVIDIRGQRGLAADFRHRLVIATNNRATAGLSFDDRPAETFKARRIKQRQGGTV